MNYLKCFTCIWEKSLWPHGRRATATIETGTDVRKDPKEEEEEQE